MTRPKMLKAVAAIPTNLPNVNLTASDAGTCWLWTLVAMTMLLTGMNAKEAQGQETDGSKTPLPVWSLSPSDLHGHVLDARIYMSNTATSIVRTNVPFGSLLVPINTTPTTITAPFYGAYGGYGDAIKWYDVTGSTAHKDYGTFDDTNAYDFNLQSDREQNLPALAVAAGTVTTLAKAINRSTTDFPGTLSGGTYGQLLIDHNGWYSGMMHLTNIKVKDGDTVSSGQLVGTISTRGGVPFHLHFSKYRKVDFSTKPGTTEKTYKLVSERVTIGNRDFTLPLPTSVQVKKGATFQISATVPFFAGQYKIQDNYYYNNTYWESADGTVATVNGSGLIRGVKLGTTTIKVKFSGKQFSVPVTVVP